MKNLFLVLISLVFAAVLFSFLVMRANTQGSENLEFFKVTKDKAIYEKNPENYYPVQMPKAGSRDNFEVYVAKVPALKIETKEIKLVIIRKERIYGPDDTSIALAELFESKDKDKVQDYPAGYSYSASFSLTDTAGIQFSSFAKKNDSESFELKLAGQRIAVVKLTSPYVGKNLLLSLETKDKHQIEEIFSSIDDKVTWE